MIFNDLLARQLSWKGECRPYRSRSTRNLPGNAWRRTQSLFQLYSAKLDHMLSQIPANRKENIRWSFCKVWTIFLNYGPFCSLFFFSFKTFKANPLKHFWMNMLYIGCVLPRIRHRHLTHPNIFLCTCSRSLVQSQIPPPYSHGLKDDSKSNKVEKTVVTSRMKCHFVNTTKEVGNLSFRISFKACLGFLIAVLVF